MFFVAKMDEKIVPFSVLYPVHDFGFFLLMWPSFLRTEHDFFALDEDSMGKAKNGFSHWQNLNSTIKILIRLNESCFEPASAIFPNLSRTQLRTCFEYNDISERVSGLSGNLSRTWLGSDSEPFRTCLANKSEHISNTSRNIIRTYLRTNLECTFERVSKASWSPSMARNIFWI